MVGRKKGVSMHTLPPATRQITYAPAAVIAPAFDEVLSVRAKRRLTILLRLRLLELREAGLDRARRVIEKRLNIEQLFQDDNTLPHDGGKTAPKI